MTELPEGISVGLLAIGAIVILSVVVRFVSGKVSLPPIVGYIFVGVAIGLADTQGQLFNDTIRHGLGLIAEIGLIVILFRVGIESDLDSLFRVLGKAIVIFISNFVVAGALGFAAVLIFTDFGSITALFVGAAMSATSVGVSTEVWRDADVLDTETGSLLVDVAELDDISAVIVIGLLFVLAPLLGGVSDASATSTLVFEIAVQLLKLGLFIGACYVFTRYLEDPLVGLFRVLDPRLGAMLFAFGMALLISAVADLIGLSYAIGAMFAGLAFSGPPTDKLIDRAFEQFYVLFSPFFFVSIGMAVNGGALSDAFGLAALLLIVAIGGKVLGAGLPVVWLGPRGKGWLFGMSMVPRAEIALVVMSYGLALGSWAVPPALYGAMVLVSLATCIIGPIAVMLLLRDGGREGL